MENAVIHRAYMVYLAISVAILRGFGHVDNVDVTPVGATGLTDAEVLASAHAAYVADKDTWTRADDVHERACLALLTAQLAIADKLNATYLRQIIAVNSAVS